MGEEKIDYDKLNDKDYKVIQYKLMLMCISSVVDLTFIRIYYCFRIKSSKYPLVSIVTFSNYNAFITS
jgi:hypothetical protein